MEIDLVNGFRHPAAVPAAVERVVARGVRVIRLQLGVGHPEARARANGSGVASERCFELEHAARRAALEWQR